VPFLTLLKEKKLKCSLTVETAMVLPIFIFALISIIYFCEIFRYSNTVASSIHQSAKAMAKTAYTLNKKDTNTNGIIEGVIISETYVKKGVNNLLAVSEIKTQENNYSLSRIMKEDIIDIIVIEKIKIPYGFLGISSLKVIDRARVHAFTGYDNTKISNKDKTFEDDVVYITKNGNVYHKDRNCSHLKITILNTSSSAIESKRNNSGGKYYPCEFCRNNSSNCFYTKYGDRYHSSINCSALKRDIISVKLSEVEGRRKCKSCGDNMK